MLTMRSFLKTKKATQLCASPPSLLVVRLLFSQNLVQCAVPTPKRARIKRSKEQFADLLAKKATIYQKKRRQPAPAKMESAVGTM